MKIFLQSTTKASGREALFVKWVEELQKVVVMAILFVSNLGLAVAVGGVM